MVGRNIAACTTSWTQELQLFCWVVEFSVKEGHVHFVAVYIIHIYNIMCTSICKSKHPSVALCFISLLIGCCVWTLLLMRTPLLSGSPRLRGLTSCFWPQPEGSAARVASSRWAAGTSITGLTDWLMKPQKLLRLEAHGRMAELFVKATETRPRGYDVREP